MFALLNEFTNDISRMLIDYKLKSMTLLILTFSSVESTQCYAQ